MILQYMVELQAEGTVENTSITDMSWTLFVAAKVIVASLLQFGMVTVASSKKSLLFFGQ